MQVKFYSHPVPHIIVDNFLGTQENQQVLTMIATVEHRMIDAEIIDHGVRRTDSGFRKNLNLWLDTFDNDTLGMMSILTARFFNPQIEQAVAHIPELNHITDVQTRTHNMVLSRYQVTDFYKWHTDGGGHVTWNYFCYQTPKQFSGGDFELSNGLYQQDRTDSTLIECLNDRLVIFPAKYQHCVTPVTATDNMLGLHNRHSIQVFFR